MENVLCLCGPDERKTATLSFRHLHSCTHVRPSIPSWHDRRHHNSEKEFGRDAVDQRVDTTGSYFRCIVQNWNRTLASCATDQAWNTMRMSNLDDTAMDTLSRRSTDDMVRSRVHPR